jgi:hypothetical protein
MKLLLVPALPTVSPPIVMVKLLPEAMLAPDVVKIMRFQVLNLCESKNQFVCGCVVIPWADPR